MITEKTDITIVGGGLVGLTTALALKDFPGSVTLIEAITPQRQVQHDYDARSIALARGNKFFLEKIGIWPAIAAHVTPILDIHISDRGHFGKSRLSAHQEQVPSLGYVIEIPDLYNALLTAVADVKNLTRYCPAKVSQVVREENNWQLHFTHDSPITQINTKCLIAADGAKSSIRQMLGVNCNGFDYKQHAVIANISLDREHRNIAYERFTEKGPMALLPLSEQRAALIWTQPSDAVSDISTLSDEDFLIQLQQAFGYYAGEFVKVGARVAYPLKSVWLEQQVQQQCVFIGNAAHTLHPIAGQGFNLSLQDIKTLVDLFIDSLEINQALFEQYVKLRKPRQQRLLRVTDLMVKSFSTSFGPLAKIRNLALGAIDHSKITKHLLTRYMMGLD